MRLFAREVMPQFRSAAEARAPVYTPATHCRDPRRAAPRPRASADAGRHRQRRCADAVAGDSDDRALSPDACAFDDVVCFQMTAEMRNRGARGGVAAEPASDHSGGVVAAGVVGRQQSVGRVSPRVRARGVPQRRARARIHVGARSRRARHACDALRDHFGFPARLADVALRHGYDGVDAR